MSSTHLCRIGRAGFAAERDRGLSRMAESADAQGSSGSVARRDSAPQSEAVGSSAQHCQGASVAFLSHSEDHVLRVRDTNLEPDYQPGDHVTVRQQKTAEPGDIVVALVDDAAVLVRWPAEDARVLGVVTGMFRRVV